MMNIDRFKSLLPKFIQYFWVGLLCAFVNWGIFYFLDATLKMYYILAAVSSWMISVILNFMLSCAVFKSKENRTKVTEFVLVILAAGTGLAIDLGAMVFCVKVLGFPNMISKVAGTGVAFVFNYASRQFFIFSHAHE